MCIGTLVGHMLGSVAAPSVRKANKQVIFRVNLAHVLQLAPDVDTNSIVSCRRHQCVVGIRFQSRRR